MSVISGHWQFIYSVLSHSRWHRDSILFINIDIYIKVTFYVMINYIFKKPFIFTLYTLDRVLVIIVTIKYIIALKWIDFCRLKAKRKLFACFSDYSIHRSKEMICTTCSMEMICTTFSMAKGQLCNECVFRQVVLSRFVAYIMNALLLSVISSFSFCLVDNGHPSGDCNSFHRSLDNRKSSVDKTCWSILQLTDWQSEGLRYCTYRK